MSFVHLRVHTEYSLTDSVIRVEPPKRKGGGSGTTLTARVAELRQPAVAVTDRMNLFAMVKVYKAAEGAGVKPIIGADLWLAEKSPGDGPQRLTLLAQNETGYRNLTRLISSAYVERPPGAPAQAPALCSFDELRALGDGLIALTGREGAICRAAAADNVGAALAALDELAAIFPERLYLEISRCGRAGDESWVEAAVALSRHRGVPVVATNDVRFAGREEFEMHEARVCIAQGRLLSDDKRPRDYSEEQYLKSSEEMAELFADLPEAIANTVAIARRCSVSLSFGTYHLPEFPVPEGETADSWIRLRAREGLAWRLSQSAPARSIDEYQARLDYELGIIEKMGFAGYFLVVSDFIEWAKQNGCPVGPGRGSGAGSLVAYSLKITDLDPLPYNLLFERFLNPERVSMPDFDVDFCMDNRDRVIEYVTAKYGRSHVSQIITYATMAARGVVRDVCRVMGHGFGFGDRIAKLIPGTPGATLADALDEVPELKAAYDAEEDVRAVLDLALALEGMTRGVGVHAGGVVIAPRPLVEYAPLYCEPDGSGVRTQFDMKDIESIGLVKFDFLGLKTLTVIQAAVDLINRQRDTPLEMLAVPLDDAETYALYASGDTTAVFQMESPGMQKASRDLKPDTFEDIIALVSLYRPGPMDLIPDYCARKRGDAEVSYLHPLMEEVLSPTYGIFVYQEQVMQMSQRLAGYTLGGADLLRRAMGKKKADEMAQQRAIFIRGAHDNGIDEATATAVFDLMEKFANYGFNKSHAAAYALVSYHTAWLKRHYPAEFMAAVLSCEMGQTETIVAMREECLRMGLTVHKPDINRSHARFTVPAPRQIDYGLAAIKGVGQGAVDSILSARDAHGLFRDLFDFCRRIDLKRVNKRVLEALVMAGALDGLGLNRASLMRNLPTALQMAEREAEAHVTGQNDMFGLGTDSQAERITVKAEIVDDWDLRQRLDHEKATLGFYLSGHPLDAFRELIEQTCSGTSLRALLDRHALPAPVGADGKRIWQPRQRVMFAAWVVDVRFFKGDKNGFGRSALPSYRITLEDPGAQIATWIDGEKWPEIQAFVKPEQMIFVTAEIGLAPAKDGREAEPRLYAPEFLSLDRLMEDHASRVRLCFRRPLRDVTQLRDALSPYRSPRGAAVEVEYQASDGAIGATAVLDLGDAWRLRVHRASLAAVQRLLGAECVKVSYKAYVPPVVERRFERSFVAAADDE